MTTWYFYNNNEISDSLSAEEIKQYIQDNPNAYGWNSSLTQWLPVHYINEFAEFVTKAPKALGEIPKALVDEFEVKKNKLQQMVNRLEKEIKQAEKSLADLDAQIERYKKLTVNLNAELKDNIVGMDKQYGVASKKLALLNSALDIAKSEIHDAVAEFNDDTMDYTVSTSPANKTPKKVAEVTDIKAKTKASAEKSSPVKKQAKVNENTAEVKSENKEKQSESDVNSKGLNVKNMFKSVFKASEEKAVALSVSERLKQAEKANDSNAPKAAEPLKVWL